MNVQLVKPGEEGNRRAARQAARRELQLAWEGFMPHRLAVMQVREGVCVSVAVNHLLRA